MKNMRIPSRPAPSIEEAQARQPKYKISLFERKKAAPPRPPPPNFNKIKSKSAWNLNTDNVPSLIEWSPPTSPKGTTHGFNGSVSSSFSSSTSSLASSKKSFEYEAVTQNPWSNNIPFPFPTMGLQAKTDAQQKAPQPRNIPTIIRAQPSKKPIKLKTDSSKPMPTIPPPSPPKEMDDSVSPFGIALYDYHPAHHDDLQLQANDIVYLIRKLNDEWLYGRIDDKEGMFPANYVDIHVPLEENDSRIVTALYDFHPQLPSDLELKRGQSVTVIKQISNEWLMGESNGRAGQFPANFVDRIPKNL